MNYKALYRKYRPTTLNEVVGQEHIVKTLTNQIQSQRVAHAYLFTGSRGTGKTSIAKIFARSVNCESPINGSACKTCATCKSVEDGSAINIIEMDAASNNGVDNIRNINDEVMYTPAVGKYKVYIIDEVHMLSTGAFNALLKTLEEPPAHVIFILATTDPQKIPATIVSRCQRYDFKRLTISEITGALTKYMKQENVDIEESAINYIARLSDGGMRDALSILEQCISFFFDEKITLEKVLKLMGAVDNSVLFDTVDAIIKSNSTRLIELCEEVNTQGRNLKQFANDLVTHVRDLIVVSSTKNTVGVLDYSADHIERLRNQSKEISMTAAKVLMKELSKLEQELKSSVNQKASLEIGLLNMCDVQIPELHEKCPSENLVARVAELENLVKSLMEGKVMIASEESGVVAKDKNPIISGVTEVFKKIQARATKDFNEEKTAEVEEFLEAPVYEQAVSESNIEVEQMVEVAQNINTEPSIQESVEPVVEEAQAIQVEEVAVKEAEPVELMQLVNAEQQVNEEAVAQNDVPTIDLASLVNAEQQANEEVAVSVEDNAVDLMQLINAEQQANEEVAVSVEDTQTIDLMQLINAEQQASEEAIKEVVITPIQGQIENQIREVVMELPKEPTPLEVSEYVKKEQLFKSKLSMAGRIVLSKMKIADEKTVKFLCSKEMIQVSTILKEEFESTLSQIFEMPKTIEVVSI